MRHSSTGCCWADGRRRLEGTAVAVLRGSSSSALAGGTIRKQVRTGSAREGRRRRQSPSLPASAAISSPSASTTHREGQGGQPGVDHSAGASPGPPAGRWAVGATAGQRVGKLPHQQPQRVVVSRHRLGKGPRPGPGPSSQERCGKRPPQRLDPTTVGAVDDRPPAGPPSVGGGLQGRQHLPPGGQLQGHPRPRATNRRSPATAMPDGSEVGRPSGVTGHGHQPRRDGLGGL